MNRQAFYQRNWYNNGYKVFLLPWIKKIPYAYVIIPVRSRKAVDMLVEDVQ